MKNKKGKDNKDTRKGKEKKNQKGKSKDAKERKRKNPKEGKDDDIEKMLRYQKRWCAVEGIKNPKAMKSSQRIKFLKEWKEMQQGS